MRSRFRSLRATILGGIASIAALAIAGGAVIAAQSQEPADPSVTPPWASAGSYPLGCKVVSCAPIPTPGGRLNLPALPKDKLDGTYLYVATPGEGNNTKVGGAGIAVFDADHGYKFVKRIPIHFSVGPEAMKGISAGVSTGLAYITTPYRLVAINLENDRAAWENSFDGYCCDRGEISPDEKTLYMPALDDQRWLVVNAASGQLETSFPVGPQGHNTMYSPTGKYVYLSPAEPYIYMVDTKDNKVARKIGPFDARLRPFAINGKETRMYASIDGLEGIQYADIATGKVLGKVEVPNMPCTRGGHGNCTHGIAMTHDEKEVWLADTTNGRPGGFVHVFDVTGATPKFKQSIPTRASVSWLTCSIDGKRMYPASGDVIDIPTKKIVAVLTDEQGQAVESEKMMEIKFSKGKVVAAGSQWCNGEIGAPHPSSQAAD